MKICAKPSDGFVKESHRVFSISRLVQREKKYLFCIAEFCFVCAEQGAGRCFYKEVIEVNMLFAENYCTIVLV